MADPDITPFLLEGAKKNFNLVQLQNLIYNKTGYRFSLKFLQHEISSRCSVHPKKSKSVFASFPSLCPGRSLRTARRLHNREYKGQIVQVVELSEEELKDFYSKEPQPLLIIEIAGRTMEFALPDNLSPEALEKLLISKGAQAL